MLSTGGQARCCGGLPQLGEDSSHSPPPSSDLEKHLSSDLKCPLWGGAKAGRAGKQLGGSWEITFALYEVCLSLFMGETPVTQRAGLFDKIIEPGVQLTCL